MPTCHVCNGDEFEEEDGLFYCSVCQTQSQVMQSVELEETDGPMLSFGTLREIGQKRKTRDHSEHFKKEYEAGRPWSKYEAYQLILQAQADALISKGAHPSVKDAVLRLWAKFLSKLGVAFTDKIRLVPKGLGNMKWHREVCRGDFDHPEVNHRRLKRNIRNSEYLTSVRKQPRDKNVQDAASALEGETFYEGDNPFEEENREMESSGTDLSDFDTSDDSLEEGDEERDIGGDLGDMSQAEKARVSQKKRKLGYAALYQQPEYMRLRKTLVFCYLACLFTSPRITLSDIIRWAKEGSVPYLETTNLLHSDMKLTAFDAFIFKPGHLLNPVLLAEAGSLANYLGIEQLPPFPVKWTISSFIVALDLPAEMHSLVLKLYARMPVDVCYQPGQPFRSSVPNVDAVCAAYIFVMLKVIFGLDDVTERQLSLYTKKVHMLLAPAKPLFDWSEWHSHITRKFLSDDSAEVDVMCQVFHRAGYQDQTFTANKLYNTTRRKRDPKYKQESREMLKRPLNSLLERWTQRDERARRLRHHNLHVPQSPSQDTDDQPLLDPSVGNEGSGDSDEESACGVAKRLRESTLRHVMEPEVFMRTALAEKKERGGVVRSQTEGVSSVASSSQLSAGSSHEPSQESKKRGRTTEKHQSSSRKSASWADMTDEVDDMAGTYDEVSHECNVSSEVPAISSTSSVSEDNILSELLSTHVSAQDRYIIYPQLSFKQERFFPHLKQEVLEAKHYSYRWLLSVCSRLTHCPVATFEKFVRKVQQCFVAHDFSRRMAAGGADVDSADEFVDSTTHWKSPSTGVDHGNVNMCEDADVSTLDASSSTRRKRNRKGQTGPQIKSSDKTHTDRDGVVCFDYGEQMKSKRMTQGRVHPKPNQDFSTGETDNSVGADKGRKEQRRSKRKSSHDAQTDKKGSCQSSDTSHQEYKVSIQERFSVSPHGNDDAWKKSEALSCTELALCTDSQLCAGQNPTFSPPKRLAVKRKQLPERKSRSQPVCYRHSTKDSDRESLSPIDVSDREFKLRKTWKRPKLRVRKPRCTATRTESSTNDSTGMLGESTFNNLDSSKATVEQSACDNSTVSVE